MPQTAPQSSSKTLAWLRLLRLPNVFTAMADVLLGFFLVAAPGAEAPWGVLALLLGASSALYLAGMVLNDVFDVEQDRRERPERPIPAGAISFGLARLVGFELLILGAALGWAASFLVGGLRAGLVATALAAAVLAYDAFLKRTPLGPLGMGACRFLNVLLGASATQVTWQAAHYAVAGGIGLYIVGVTWFARTEARESNRLQLSGATLTMAAGIGMLFLYPTLAAGSTAPVLQRTVSEWYLLLGVLATIILGRCGMAIIEPLPARVQMAVKQCILSLVILDATVCLAARGWQPAVLILALLAPAMLLGRWVYST